MQTEWWRTFFDDRYIDVWASKGMFARTEEEVAGVLGLLPGEGPLRILDVPCGFGRHSAALHARGHDVTGLDLSAAQLAIAEQRNPGPTYVQGDMRHPPRGPFDAVLNLFSSIGYFDTVAEDVAALRAWHEVLAPGGTLLIETNHRDRIVRIHTPGEVLPIGEEGAVEFGDMDWVRGVMKRTVRHADGTELQFTIRLYTVTQLVKLVADVGYVDVEVFGSWGGSPVSPDTRLVLRARKPPLYGSM